MRFGLKVSDSADVHQPRAVRLLPRRLLGPRAAADDGHDRAGAPDGNLGWYKSEPTVTLHGRRGRSARSTATASTAAPGRTTASRSRSTGQGNHTVEYYVGRQGRGAQHRDHQDARRSASTPRRRRPRSRSAATWAPAARVDVQLDAADGDLGSGAVLTQYRVDGGPWTTYSAKDEQIFDGTAASLAQWRQAPARSVRPDDRRLGRHHAGRRPGHALVPGQAVRRTSGSSSSSARAGRTAATSNGGVFVRFPDPRVPTAQRPDACARTGSAATSEAWVAIYCGHEFQLFDGIEPNSEPQKTGSVYNFDTNTISQIGTPKATGEWEDYEIEVVGQTLQDLPQRRADQRVRSTRRARPRAAAATRTRASASSRVATSACRTTAAPTPCSTATSACEDLTPGAATANPTGLFTVAGDGQHTVEFRSIDAAGNVEERKSYDVRDRRPDAAPARTRRRSPSAADLDDPAAADRHARVATASARCRRGSRGRRSTRRGLSVPVACTGAMTGSATLTRLERRRASG